MSTALRFLTIIAAIALVALLLTPTLHARPQSSAADVTLLNAVNRDRAEAGLFPLKWNNALATAAHQHALRMARANTLSHQLPGELPLQDRARHAGVHFSLIAENVAEGPIVAGLHTQWMNSPPHRANLLDPQLTAIGISVVQSGKMFFAVEDFSGSVAARSLQEQEQQIASLSCSGSPSGAIRSLNAGHNELPVAFSAELSTLAPMNFAAYSYCWRFTYRTTRERGAAV